MRWFGFGFNSFGQVCPSSGEDGSDDAVQDVKVSKPTELKLDKLGRQPQSSQISASWSRRASLCHLEDSCVRLAGFGAAGPNGALGAAADTRGCEEVSVGETHLTLAFRDRIESWDLQSEEKKPSWRKELVAQSDSSAGATLPLVPGGYIASKPPIFRSLSPHLQAKSLALGGEHAVLLTATGAVHTWGLGSHGQLGHGGLVNEEQPRPVEALWGLKMSCVAAGGWHSVCVSDGGDLYVWGWNESGQLGLPSRALRNASNQQGKLGHSTASCEETQEGGKHDEVFISIQPFPALQDLSPVSEIRAVSCGSRHTAAVTTSGNLYTWGWGEYGQLGHETLTSLDEPQCVEFFRTEELHVVDVVCGSWNTFTAVIKQEDFALKMNTSF